MTDCPRLVVAGTSSNVGKTTVTLAILAALRERGRLVQSFKAGPDFIDPGHHTAVTGRPSRNLDGWMLGADLNREIFAHAAADADLSIIEGVMGLFDGSSPVSEVGSTAELAKQLAAPVLLVVDGSGMARSAAAMVSGYASFDPALRVVGVLFNRVGSDGHYRLLKEAVEAETDVAVVGYLRSNSTMGIPDRYLGLVVATERGTDDLYPRLGQAAAQTVDLDLIESLAQSSSTWVRGKELGVRETLSASVRESYASSRSPRRIRIGVARDQAFCFYYPENLELLQAAGAEVVTFSPLRDHLLPDVEMLYLGGGYPELHGDLLAKNVGMRTAVRRFAGRGGVIYAECGGMMYLTQAIRDFSGTAHEMVGLFPAEAVMRRSSMTLGYRTVECLCDGLLGESGVTARGHEFHYSSVVQTGSVEYVCALRDAQGSPKGPDGLATENVLALYTHLHFSSNPQIAHALADAARRPML